MIVTGASGFIGRHAVSALAGKGHAVTAISRSGRPADMPEADNVRWISADILDAEAAKSAVDKAEADTLVHIAWDVSPGYWTAPNNLQWLEASLHLARVFRDAGGRRIVSAGSCAEYDWSDAAIAGGDLDERTSAFNPATFYATCKRSLHTTLASWGEEAGISVAWGLLFFSFGPFEQRQRLLPDVALALLRGEVPRTTAGTQVRDFMDARDAGAAMAALAESVVTGPVNIALGDGLSIADFVDLIRKHTAPGATIERGALPMREGDPARIVANVERLSNEVGFTPEYSVDAGVRDAVSWWRAQL